MGKCEVGDMTRMHKSTGLLLLRNCVAAMGGLFWGYFQSHFNVTSDIYDIIMDISPDHKATFNGLCTGMIQFGGIFGAVLSCLLVNKMSRRSAFVMIDVLALVGVGVHCVQNVALLYVGNFMGGMAMGLNSAFIGTYIVEVSPTLVAGLMGSLVQYTISVGMILLSVLGLFMPTTEEFITQGQHNHFYLVIFLVPALFPIIRLLCMGLVYKLDTPVYYARRGDRVKLVQALEEIYLPEYVHKMADDLSAYNQSQDQEEQKLGDIFRDPLIRRKTMIGVGLAFAMQVSGINSVMLYSNKIFQGGKSSKDAQQLAQMLTLVNYFMLIVANVVAGFMVDRLGRKTILCAGQIGLTVLLAALSGCGYGDVQWPLKYLVILFTVVFGLSQGPVIWLYIPEIISGKHLSVACASVWVFATIVSFSVPVAFESALGQYGTFAIFGAGTFLLIFWEFYFLVESKCRTKQEIDSEFIEALGLGDGYQRVK